MTQLRISSPHPASYGTINMATHNNNAAAGTPPTNTTPSHNKNKYDLLIDDEVNEHISVLTTGEQTDIDTLHNKTYSPLVCYCFTVNYVLGVGVLSMPYVFYHAGYVLSTLTLFSVTMMAIVTANYTSDSHARAQLIAAHRKAQTIHLDMSSPMPTLGYTAQTQRIAVKQQSVHIYQFNELVGFYINKHAKLFYDVCISCYMFGTLHMFSSIVASSMAAHIPLPFINSGTVCENVTAATLSSGCTELYLIYMLMFALVVVPLTCRDLAEIAFIQVLLAMFRFFALGLICVTAIFALFKYPNKALPDSSQTAPYIADGIVPINISGIPVMLPAVIFSQIYHHSIPVLTAPLPADKQRKQPQIWSAVLTTTFCVYTMVSISTILWYGSTIANPMSLNYSNYDAGYPYERYTDLPLYVQAIGMTVVLFPVLDIVSAFPLNAITLGKNLYSSFIPYVPNTSVFSSNNYKLLFRLLASIPPIVFATFIRDLSSILKYTGCIGVVIAFIYPCALQYYSRKAWYNEFSASKLLDGSDVTRTPKIATTPVNHLKKGLHSLHSSTPISHSNRIFQSNVLMICIFSSSVIALISVFVLQVFVL